LLAVLDFDLARDRRHLEDTVRLTMFVAGLRSDHTALAAGADWVAEQVVAGHRELGLDAIEHAVAARALRAGPARAVVSVATLAPDRLAAQARYAMDWVERFDGPDAYAKRRPKARQLPGSSCKPKSRTYLLAWVPHRTSVSAMLHDAPFAAIRACTSSSPRRWDSRSSSATGGTASCPLSCTRTSPHWATRPHSPSALNNR